MASTPSRKNALTVVAVIFILLFYFLFFKGHRTPSSAPVNGRDYNGNAVTNNTYEPGYRHHTLHYTRHARCRMDCRHINETEVQEILASGQINQRKSEVNASPCPKYALEGITNEHQHLRIIVGDCDQEATIITVIDLEHEFECDCK